LAEIQDASGAELFAVDHTLRATLVVGTGMITRTVSRLADIARVMQSAKRADVVGHALTRARRTVPSLDTICATGGSNPSDDVARAVLSAPCASVTAHM
jgi:hypothetical protein